MPRRRELPRREERYLVLVFIPLLCLSPGGFRAPWGPSWDQRRVVGCERGSRGRGTALAQRWLVLFRALQHRWFTRRWSLLLLVAIAPLGGGVWWLWLPAGRVSLEGLSAGRPAAGERSPPARTPPAVLRPVNVELDADWSPRLPPLYHGSKVIALVGLDGGPGRRGSGLADTLIILVLQPEQRRMGVVGVPRDLWVDYGAPVGHDRINRFIVTARAEGLEPLELLRRVCRDTLRVEIDHWLAIDLGVFERAVDLLGGVEVSVPCGIMDDFLDERTESGRRRLEVTPGRVPMDGPTAAMYVRSRHGRSDWSRARRQQAVLLAMRDRTSGLGGMTRWPALWSQIEDSLTTDLRRYELFGLARTMLAVPAEGLHGVVLGHQEAHPARTAAGQAVLIADEPSIARRLDTLFEAPLPGLLPSNVACLPADVALRRGR